MSSNTSLLFYLVFIATLGPLQFGFHLGELNAAQPSIVHDIPMDASRWGLVQSSFTIGGLLGALLGGPLATKYGRLFGMRLLTAALFLGPVAEALAQTISTLTLGRFVSGTGAGAATVICPVYVAEVAPLAQRGLFGAFTQVMINLGIVIAQLLGYFLGGDQRWRYILGTAALIAIVTWLGLLTAPETPKWLAENNRPRMAKGVLQSVRGHDSDIRGEMAGWDWSGEAEEESLLGPPRGPRPPKEPTKSFLDVLRIPKYRKALIGVTACMMAQQLCGINSVVMYSVAILGSIMPLYAALVTVVVSTVNVVVTLACAPLADKIGRKPCLLLSAFGMGINSMLLAIGLSQHIPTLTIIALILFVCSFAVGLGPVPFILASELAGPEAVGAISSWALAGCWLSMFSVAQFFPILNAAVPRGQVYWIFTGIALFFGIFIAWWVPESRGKETPEEIWGTIDEEEQA